MSAPATNERPPPRFQFRLATLLMAMVCVGVASAALGMPTPFWAGTLLCTALSSLLIAVLVAIYRTGRTRAFAVGFLVFSGGYLAGVLLLDRSLRNIDYESAAPTSRLASWIFRGTHAQHRRTVNVQVANRPPAADPSASPNDPFAPGPFAPPPTLAVTTRVMQMAVHQPQDFVEISHSVLAMLLGFVGGIFARFLFITRRYDDEGGNLTQRRGGGEQAVG